MTSLLAFSCGFHLRIMAVPGACIVIFPYASDLGIIGHIRIQCCGDLTKSSQSLFYLGELARRNRGN
jgi:hypothetical protein